MSAASPYRTYLNRLPTTDTERVRFARRLAGRIRTMAQLRAVLAKSDDPRKLFDLLKPWLRIQA